MLYLWSMILLLTRTFSRTFINAWNTRYLLFFSWDSRVIEYKTCFVFMIFWSSHSRHYNRIACVASAHTTKRLIERFQVYMVWSESVRQTHWHVTPVKGSEQPLFKGTIILPNGTTSVTLPNWWFALVWSLPLSPTHQDPKYITASRLFYIVFVHCS